MSVGKLKSKSFHFTLDRDDSHNMTVDIDETLNEWLGKKNIEIVKIDKLVFDNENDELLFIFFYRKIKSDKKNSNKNNIDNALG